MLAASRLSPDESRVLSITIRFAGGNGITTLAARSLKRGGTSWQYRFPDCSYSEPFWLDDDVVALNGSSSGKAEVVCLSGADGHVLWRFHLPRGAYCPGRDQLPGNTYPPRNWSALGLCGQSLLAVGGEGALYLLDPGTGRLIATAAPATSYLTFPRVVDDALIVCSIQGVRAVPLDLILNRRPHDEKEVALLQAQCLDARGRTEEALSVLRPVLAQVPEFEAGWALQAELCRRAGLPLGEIAARCRHLELTGRETSRELRRRWGLLRRIATHNDIRTDLQRVGDLVYAGTAAGWVYGIDTSSLEVVSKKALPAGLHMLSRTVRLKAYLFDGSWPEVGASSDKAGPEPAGAPAAWYPHTGHDGRVVRWRGRYYRPLAGGSVRVLDGQKVTEFATKLRGVKDWQIAVSPEGPLGYGEGGVFELDKHLCPVHRLLDNGGPDITLLASDAHTLGLLTYGNEGPVLQIWSRDGKQKLREQEVTPGYLSGTRDQLLALNGGYLFSGSELTWVSAVPGAPAWRFGFGAEPGRALPRIDFAHTPLFGTPLVCNNLLFVRCRDGAIYIFDVGVLTRPAPPGRGAANLPRTNPVR